MTVGIDRDDSSTGTERANDLVNDFVGGLLQGQAPVLDGGADMISGYRSNEYSP